MVPRSSGRKGRNHFRIIAGAWRGRVLEFPDVPGLRPTPDRVRETLFNWLQPVIQGARCLDAFAGSGALGLEALSRGAGVVTFIEHERSAAGAIEGHLDRLDCETGEVICADALSWLRPGRPATGHGFDVVFLDPPFRTDLLPELCTLLDAGGWLADRALIYMECEAGAGPPELPAGWCWYRDKRAGHVAFRLAQRKVTAD